MEITINTFCQLFARGYYDTPNLQRQIEAGWYDWFCKSMALARKTQTLGKRVLDIQHSHRFNADKCYVFFKNNCPFVGPLYDQFSICDIDTGDVLFCCQCLEKGSHGCERKHWEIYAAPDFSKPVVSGTWLTCKKWFMN